MLHRSLSFSLFLVRCFLGILFLFTVLQLSSQSRSTAFSDVKRYAQEILNDRKKINSNESKIEQLDRQIPALEIQKLETIGEKDEAYQKKKEEIENSDSWKNRRKSAQQGYKEKKPGTCSAGGPPPICVANHWYLVGTAQAIKEYKKFEQEAYDKIEKEYNKKLNNLESTIKKKQEERNNLYDELSKLEYNLPEKKRKVNNAAYDWRLFTEKENDEKEKKWQDAINKEEAQKKVLENNDRMINQEIGRLKDQYNRALEKNRAKVLSLDASYEEKMNIKEEVEAELEKAFRTKEQILIKKRNDNLSKIDKYKQTRESALLKRTSEVDNWNKTKEDEIRTIQDLCIEVDAGCGSVSTALSYLPEIEVDIVNMLLKGTPGNQASGEFADEIFGLPLSLIPTYKVKRTGTQIAFESKIGVEKLTSLKAQIRNDPLSPDYGIDTKLCLEVLGKSSCIGMRFNKNTGKDEPYMEGVIKQQRDAMIKIREENDRRLENFINDINNDRN